MLTLQVKVIRSLNHTSKGANYLQCITDAVTVHCVFISSLFSDCDSPELDVDLPKYEFLPSRSPVLPDTCDEGIEKEMLDIAIERSLQAEECSHKNE